MKRITVPASRTYDIIIDHGLLALAGKYVQEVSSAQKIAIISDSNVWPLYGDTVLFSLREAGYSDTPFYIFPAGEEQKNGSNYLQILEFLAENKITRTDCLIALGGGVVGDITGFAAATYLRGIEYIQIPTTLLSAVDSSVGGKTAIDLQGGKNLAGAFCQPILVLCDTKTLDTLPERFFIDGCAEVIKYSILYDPSLFEHLCTNLLNFDREEVIATCVKWKRDVVIDDEYDHGNRQKLNLGHTVGHGVEAASHYQIYHGHAVAIGMAIITRAAMKTGYCSVSDSTRILDLLKSFSLPIETNISPETLYLTALSDKKRSGNTVNLIIPTTIGNCVIVPKAVNELKEFIELGV